MARSNLKPVSVAGIEFDALIEEQKALSATIPVYPVEDGFPVSDTIILEPVSVSPKNVDTYYDPDSLF